MSEKPVLHIVDEDDEFALLLGLLLAGDARRVERHANLQEFLLAYRPDEHAVLLLDPSIQGARGVEALEALRSCGVELPVLCLTRSAGVELGSLLTRAGAIDVVEKPFDAGTVGRALATLRRSFAPLPDRDPSAPAP